MPRQEELKKFRNPFPTTDIIIEYADVKRSKEGIVLITRKNPPYGIAIPGGFAEYGLSLEENAIKEAKEETGLDIIIETPEHPLCVHSHPDRDPRAHIMSVTYVARGHGDLIAGDDAKTATLYSIDEVVRMLDKDRFAFPDHERALKEYLVFRGYAR